MVRVVDLGSREILKIFNQRFEDVSLKNLLFMTLIIPSSVTGVLDLVSKEILKVFS